MHGQGHTLKLMWIKVLYNQNDFTDLEFLNFTIFDQNVLKILLNGKNNKSPTKGFELMTYRFEENAFKPWRYVSYATLIS